MNLHESHPLSQGDGYEPVVFRQPIMSLALDAAGSAAQGLLRAVTGGRRRQQAQAQAHEQEQAK